MTSFCYQEVFLNGHVTFVVAVVKEVKHDVTIARILFWKFVYYKIAMHTGA